MFFRVRNKRVRGGEVATGDGARVLNALALYRLVAWRVLRRTMLGRAMPDVSCEAVLGGSKWTALHGMLTGKRVRSDRPRWA